MDQPIRKASFPPVFRPDARLLVLGSLPGDRSLAQARYYAHPQNQFWLLISAAIGRDIAGIDYHARLDALLDARVALWDVVASARRTGSTDAAIRHAAANDLPGLVAALPRLRAVAFNGGTAGRIGRAALGDVARGLAFLDLPSSSPLHTVGIAAKRPAWAALAAWLADGEGASPTSSPARPPASPPGR